MNTTGGKSFIRMGRWGTGTDEDFTISKNIHREGGIIKDDENSGFQSLNFDGDGNFSITTDPSTSTGSTSVRLYIKNDGNVGIGCTDPEHNLQVSADNDGVDYDKIGLNNSSKMSIVAVNQPSYGKYGFYFGVVNNGNAWLQTGRSGTANSASTGVDFNLLLQPKSGNVGIGTTNPETKLDIDSSDGDGITIHSGNSSGYILQ